MPFDNLSIVIRKSDEGWMYDIYDLDPEDIDSDSFSLDGGLCTGTFKDAFALAVEDARAIIDKLPPHPHDEKSSE